MENKEAIKISIIIPIYNTPSNSLKANIDSILAQRFSDYEVIMVDDGSEIKCASMIDQIAESDCRIRVIHQQNGGVSKARNAGIAVACAPYIVFVDADDIVNKNFLNEAYHYITKYNPDIIFGTLEYTPSREIKQNNGVVEEFTGTKIEDVKRSLLGIEPRRLNYRVLGTPCARIYRTKIVKNVLFPVGVPLCEDQIFNRKMLKNANKVLVVPETWYCYIQNDFSAMHNTMRKSYYNMAKPYWDELLIMNCSEEPSILEQLRIMSLGLYYTVIQKDFFNLSKSIYIKTNEMKNVARHPLIQDAVDNLSLGSRNLSPSQKVGLFLMKRRMFFILYCLQWLKNRGNT